LDVPRRLGECFSSRHPIGTHRQVPRRLARTRPTRIASAPRAGDHASQGWRRPPEQQADVARGQATDAESLGERDDRSIHKPKAKVGVPPIDVHGSRELIECGRRVGQHQGRNIASAGSVDGASKQTIVRHALDQIVEQCASVADQRGSTTGHQRTARARRRARSARGRCPHSSAWDAGGTARARGRGVVG